MEKEKFNKQKYDNEYIKNNKDRINFLMPKGRKEEIQQIAKASGITASEWINAAITEKMNGEPEQEKKTFVDTMELHDLSAYARSAGMTEEEYIKAAVLEKMQKQDAEYSEDITRESIND